MSDIVKRLFRLEEAIRPKERDFLWFYRNVSSEEFMERAEEADSLDMHLDWSTGKILTYKEYEKKVGPKWAAIAKRNHEQIAKLRRNSD